MERKQAIYNSMHPGFENIRKFISKYSNFIISTHESPDCDGLGAEIAFRELLTHLGKKAIIVNSDPTPEKFSFIDEENEINIFTEDLLHSLNISHEALFVLDTNDISNIGTLHRYLDGKVDAHFIIDHHEGGKDKFEANFIRVEASSVCEIIYDIISHFEQKITPKAAKALFAGIVFDTGSFRYPKTSPKTFKIASHLVELGADPFSIYESIYENNSMSSFELRALMLASMEIHYGGKVVLLKLTPDMLKKTKASFEEGEMNVNLPLTIKGVVASILVKQNETGPVKVSMRTKGNYDVSKIAMENGGGGHRNAAGYKSSLSFEETCKKAINEIGKFFL
ncbi:MAG: bifunctional oligoribonuclease/PAP phosphatase NrnA [Spirochaetes bacterium]|nr:bifunctional oligoribonuclease/PAP phosphatase NrnA [Spirochaetota bacterium]